MSFKICTIIRETLGLDQSEPINRETLMTDLPFDSLRYVQMIVKIEDEFNIKFDEFSLIQSPTASVGSLVELVKNHGQTV